MFVTNIGKRGSNYYHNYQQNDYSFDLEKYCLIAVPKTGGWSFRKYTEKYNLPMLCGGWFYKLGEDDDLLKANLKLGAELGSKFHNVQIFLHLSDGHILSDSEIAEKYLEVYEFGDKIGCLPCFEIHINMWSEDFL